MRVVREINKPNVKITIFNWNGKFLIKFEQGYLEQTYKVDELDLISEGDLDNFLTAEFINAISLQFKTMNDILDKFHSTL